jgi:multimeric flavodoxin WrbA
MKKVAIFMGSPRKKNTYDAVREFARRLEALGGVECEIVSLSDYQIEACRGCQVCFDRGEEFCPLRDDRDALFEKIMYSDGVVFASPNYSFQVSGTMKNFLDRMGFLFHRPRFHGKISSSIVVQGIYGGGKIVKYLDFASFGLGFKVVKGSCVTFLQPMTEKDRRKRDKVLAKHSKRFHERLMKPLAAAPTWLELVLFRMRRTSMKATLDESAKDYQYYSEQGWFDADYYYPTKLGLLKKSAGHLFDFMFKQVYRARAA